MDKEIEARKLVEQAKKKLKGGFFKSLFSSETSRKEEALDLYERAGNIFKLCKLWAEAGECFLNCGELEESLKADPTSNYQDSAHCYKFVDIKKSNEVLMRCLQLYENNGRFQMAGKIMKQMAEEAEGNMDYPQALLFYRKGADYFAMETSNSKSYEQGCLLKLADLLCLTDDPEAPKEAKTIYEKIALQYLTVPLLKLSAKDLFFKTVVTYLAYEDQTIAEAYLNKFIDEDPTFNDTRESNFLMETIKAFTDKKVEAFRMAVTKLKQYNDFDKWRVHMFTKIMNKIENQTSVSVESYV